MTLLVLCGYHAEELEFGNLVKEAYIGKYPDNDVMFHTMKYPDTPGTMLMNDKTTKELSLLIDAFCPSAMIEIHNSLMAVPVTMRELAIHAYNTQRWDPLLYVFSHPLVYFYENMSVDKELGEMLGKEERWCSYYSILEDEYPGRMGITLLNAHDLKVPWVNIEAMVNTNDDKTLIRDRDYLAGKKEAVRFIRKIELFYSRP